MKQAPIPANDRERVEALEDYDILASTPETWFDHIVTVASRLCDAPIALVSLVGRDQQFFKAATGLPEGLTCGSRANSFCGHAILEPGVFEVPDTLRDERFRDNPWVTEETGVRFYAGVRLLNDDGFALGTICVLDQQPRHLTDSQKEALESLASVVMQHIETRRAENFGQHLRRLIETSDHFVAILDASDFRILHVNERLEGLLSTRDGPPDLRSLPVEAVFPSLDMAFLRELASQDPETATPTDLVSAPIVSAGEEDFVVRLRITPSQVRERRVLLLVAEDMGKLMSSLHQAERAASEVRRLALVARLTDNPVIITDAEDYIEWVNPSFERMTGYALDEVIGRRPGSFLQGPDTDEGARQRLRAALRAGEAIREEVLNYDRHGNPYWLDLDIQPVYDQRNVLVSFVAIQTDITQRKELEGYLRRARDEAEASDQAKSQFLANISHELRTPLNGIVGITELLDRNPDRPDLADQLATLRDSANGLLGIINDLLDLSKIEARSLELESRPFDLRALLRNLDNLFRPQVEQKGVHLLVSVDEGLPVHFFGDSLRLKQVLMNLLNNAVKFTDQGAIELDVARGEQFGDTLNLVFSVQDSGPGIDPSVQARIFEPFGQADASLARRYGGTGLGLTICQRLVTLMGGSLGLASREGEGARFHFTLPMLVASEEDAAALMESRPNVQAGVPARAFRVLLVDDNPINRQVGAAMVEELGGSVQSCQSGREAIAAFERAPFDLVLLDIRMPDMNGYDVATRLRELEASSHRRTPILAVTAHSAPGPEAGSQQAMDAFLTKPLTFAALQAAIQQALGDDAPVPDQPEPAPAGAPADTDALIDEALVLRNLNNDPALVAKLRELFEEQHARYLQQLDEALASGDHEALADAAHSLKGAVGYFTGGELWQAVAGLEKAARAGEQGLADAVARVRPRVVELAEAVRAFTPGQS